MTAPTKFAKFLAEHERLRALAPVLPTDYAAFGGNAMRWDGSDDLDADCSWGCRWARWLEDRLGDDWCVCTKAGAPRCGLLTFEHQAGRGCFEAGK